MLKLKVMYKYLNIKIVLPRDQCLFKTNKNKENSQMGQRDNK